MRRDASLDIAYVPSPLTYWNPAPAWYKPVVAKVVVLASRLVISGLNRFELQGREHLDAAWDRGSRGLLSISNHVSLFDDPMLPACFAETRWKPTRWVAADAKNFFNTRLKGWFFSAGKCVPIVRGAGPDQVGLRFLIDRLRAGEWVHFFPEGGRSRDPDARLRHPFKPGIARLIEEAMPVMLPFYHLGMGDVLPIGARLPRLFKRVVVRIGAATNCDEAFLETFPEERRHHAVGEWAYEQLRSLECAVHPAG